MCNLYHHHFSPLSSAFPFVLLYHLLPPSPPCRPDLALEFCGKATKLYQQRYGDDHELTHRALDLLTSIYAEVGKSEYEAKLSKYEDERSKDGSLTAEGKYLSKLSKDVTKFTLTKMICYFGVVFSIYLECSPVVFNLWGHNAACLPT